jgi:uncharacterized Zn finger protein
MAWRGDDYGRFFPPSRPRAAKGGIKAQSRSWWARRWIRVLEGFDLGARLRRGRSYARSGQVLDVVIEKGVVRSSVQGSRPKPYAVTLEVRALSAAGWKKLATALAAEARFTAKLLAGEMPEDVIFKLRGMAREDLVGLLGTAGARRPGRSDPRVEEEEATPAPTQSLRAHPSAFWEGGALPVDPFGEVQVPAEPAALLKRLAAFPFWRGSATLAAAFEPTYAQASARGLDAFLGTCSGG